ncbi:hypothetical protein [Beijerinckia mobilis]|uniref:hypothetical protein n=1 Tax=Beijerinckia mobilis TaxID=231434 RepID=UPI0012EB9802|nr:hypothetical protein [Beijerinckia mobilis]
MALEAVKNFVSNQLKIRLKVFPATGFNGRLLRARGLQISAFAGMILQHRTMADRPSG